MTKKQGRPLAYGGGGPLCHAHPHQTLKIKKCINSIRQCILSAIGSVYQMFNIRRITLFCFEKRFSKHKMTIFSKTFGWGMAPLVPPGYAYALPPPRKSSAYATGVNYPGIHIHGIGNEECYCCLFPICLFP